MTPFLGDHRPAIFLNDFDYLLNLHSGKLFTKVIQIIPFPNHRANYFFLKINYEIFIDSLCICARNGAKYSSILGNDENENFVTA